MKAYDANIELQILKSICDSPEGVRLLSKINEEYFGYDPAKEIFTRIINLIGNGKAIPSTQILRQDEALTDQTRAALSAETLYSLKSDDEQEAALENLDKYRKGRLLLNTISESLQTLSQSSPDVDSVISSIENTLQRCHTGKQRDEMIHITSSNIDQLLNEVKTDLTTQTDGFIPSSFGEFDKRTGGFHRKNVIVLASVPGGGKSAMAMQMAINQYMMGYNVCYISYEMDEIELKYRMLSTLSKIEHREINLKILNQKQIEYILKKWEEFVLNTGLKNRLTIWCPTREMNIPELTAQIMPYGFDAVYVDYLGLLKEYPGKAMWESLGAHARAAKLSANSLNAALILLAQYDDQENKIKYSKAIQANAHFVWAWDNNEQEKESGIIQVKQLKARNAEVYNFYLQRDFKTMTFSDYTGPPPDQKDSESNEEPSIPKMPELT